jgi:hypothetical protein
MDLRDAAVLIEERVFPPLLGKRGGILIREILVFGADIIYRKLCNYMPNCIFQAKAFRVTNAA